MPTAASGAMGLVIHGKVEFSAGSKQFPDGKNRDYGYWRSSLHESTKSKFDQVFLSFEGSGVVGSNPNLVDPISGKSYTHTGGVGTRFDAGELISRFGDRSIQERSFYLAKQGYINVGSGVGAGNSFTAYAKFAPSGEMSDSVLIGKHKESLASIVLGCDFDGKFYVRTDAEVSGVNQAYYARSSTSFTDYKYPVQLVGVYASGDSKLKLYINGSLEDQTSTFSRSARKEKNTDLIIGKREYPISESPYTGWLDEVGVSSRSFSDKEVDDLYRDTFELSSFIDTDVSDGSTSVSTGTISKCACTNLPEKVTAEITDITLTEGGTDKGAIGQKVDLTYDASATYTDSGADTYTGIWDSGTVNLDCDNTKTVRYRLYCNGSNQFVLANNFSFMSSGEELRDSQTCDPLNITFEVAGTTSGGGSCCSDDAATQIDITITGAVVSNTGYGEGFSSAFPVFDQSYIRFKTSKQNAEGARSGAFDQDLWSNSDFQVSSEVRLDMTDISNSFYQFQGAKLEIDIEHLTNHWSGGHISASLLVDPELPSGLNYPFGVREIGWTSDTLYVPSGARQRVTLSGVYGSSSPKFPHLRENSVSSIDGKYSAHTDFNNNELKLLLYYPSSGSPLTDPGSFDSEFRIYSARMKVDGFYGFSSPNANMSLFNKGGVWTSGTGSTDLYLASHPVTQSMPLFLKSERSLLTSSSNFSAGSKVTTYNSINLSVTGGLANTSMNMFVKTVEWSKTQTNSPPLYVKGGVNVLPFKYGKTTLFLRNSEVHSGPSDASVSMMLAGQLVGTLADRRLLYIKGKGVGPLSDTYNYSQDGRLNLFLGNYVAASSNSLDLYLSAPSVYSPSGSMNLLLKVYDPIFWSQGSLSPVGTVSKNNNTTLVTMGHGVVSSGMNLVMPNTIGNKNNTLRLRTRG